MDKILSRQAERPAIRLVEERRTRLRFQQKSALVLLHVRPSTRPQGYFESPLYPERSVHEQKDCRARSPRKDRARCNKRSLPKGRDLTSCCSRRSRVFVSQSSTHRLLAHVRFPIGRYPLRKVVRLWIFEQRSKFSQQRTEIHASPYHSFSRRPRTVFKASTCSAKEMFPSSTLSRGSKISLRDRLSVSI